MQTDLVLSGTNIFMVLPEHTTRLNWGEALLLAVQCGLQDAIGSVLPT